MADGRVEHASYPWKGACPTVRSTVWSQIICVPIPTLPLTRQGVTSTNWLNLLLLSFPV